MDDARQFWPSPLVICCRWAIWVGGAISLLSAFLVTFDVAIRAILRVSLLESFDSFLSFCIFSLICSR